MQEVGTVLCLDMLTPCPAWRRCPPAPRGRRRGRAGRRSWRGWGTPCSAPPPPRGSPPPAAAAPWPGGRPPPPCGAPCRRTCSAPPPPPRPPPRAAAAPPGRGRDGRPATNPRSARRHVTRVHQSRAWCSGVQPALVLWLRLAPRPTSAATSASCPLAAATCSGLTSPSSAELTPTSPDCGSTNMTSTHCSSCNTTTSPAGWSPPWWCPRPGRPPAGCGGCAPWCALAAKWQLVTGGTDVRYCEVSRAGESKCQLPGSGYP